MYRVMVMSAVMLSAGSIAAQEDYGAVFDGSRAPRHLSFYGGLTFEHHAAVTNTKPGFEAGVVMNRMFIAGLYGQGTTGNFGVRYEDRIHNIMLGEGGLMAGIVVGYSRPVHFGGMLKIGAISLVADDNEIQLFEEVDPIAEDAGAVYHPELFAETNLSRLFKVRMGAGYTFNNLDEESVICNRKLDSWTMNVSILAGNFWK